MVELTALRSNRTIAMCVCVC